MGERGTIDMMGTIRPLWKAAEYRIIEDRELKFSAMKTCLCDHLGNGALINLGIKKEEKAPQAVCPGQNINWFNREYSLMEMMEHFYNKRKSLISIERPHMFAKEIQMYVDYFDKLLKESELNERVSKTLKDFYKNLQSGMEYCRNFSQKKPFTSENV